MLFFSSIWYFLPNYRLSTVCSYSNACQSQLVCTEFVSISEMSFGKCISIQFCISHISLCSLLSIFIEIVNLLLAYHLIDPKTDVNFCLISWALKLSRSIRNESHSRNESAQFLRNSENRTGIEWFREIVYKQKDIWKSVDVQFNQCLSSVWRKAKLNMYSTNRQEIFRLNRGTFNSKNQSKTFVVLI